MKMTLVKKIMTTLAELQELPDDFVLSVGNFDGVHLGHQYFIKQALSYAQKRNCKLVILTFSQHSKIHLLGQDQLKTENNQFALLITPEIKHELIFANHVNYIFVEDFSLLMKKKCDEFIHFLKSNLPHCRGLFLGHDSKLGCDQINANDLIVSENGLNGFSIEVATAFKLPGGLIPSSTNIRAAFKTANMPLIRAYLGRNFYFYGQVLVAKGLGRSENVPTANIKYPIDLVQPLKGVYITRLFLDDEVFPAISNIGNNPTMDNYQYLMCETHILTSKEFHLTHKQIKVELLEFIREEKKFSNKDELFNQIRSDIFQAKKYHDMN